MNFIDAYKELHNGKCIKRERWNYYIILCNYMYCQIIETVCCGDYRSWRPAQADLLANDWMVSEEGW